MSHEQDRLGASSQSEDRAATLSEPSQSSVGSGKAGIPCAFTPVDLLLEQMGEALFNLSDSLRESGFLDNAAHHARYEAVVIAWRGLGTVLAKARGQ